MASRALSLEGINSVHGKGVRKGMKEWLLQIQEESFLGDPQTSKRGENMSCTCVRIHYVLVVKDR